MTIFSILKILTQWLPDSYAGVVQWRQLFCDEKHGHSLSTLYRICSKRPSRSTPAFLLLESTEGHVFGAFLSELPRIIESSTTLKHYGSGETFLFNLNYSESKKYSWTGENSFFETGDIRHFAVGGGSGTHGLWIDSNLCEGSSEPCETYGNDVSIAGGERDFTIRGLQLWSLE